MKTFFTTLLFLGCFLGFSQEKYLTKNGTLHFEASVPSFEEVDATNGNVSGVLDAATGEFAALALMKGFRFKVALMEEHFNENYVESDTYPKAIFKGTIENFDLSALSSEARPYAAKGELTLHGKTKALSLPLMLSKDGDGILATSTFTLNPEDFDIKIPQVVRKKIAESVNVVAEFRLKKK